MDVPIPWKRCLISAAAKLIVPGTQVCVNTSAGHFLPTSSHVRIHGTKGHTRNSWLCCVAKTLKPFELCPNRVYPNAGPICLKLLLAFSFLPSIFHTSQEQIYIRCLHELSSGISWAFPKSFLRSSLPLELWPSFTRPMYDCSSR